MTKVVSQEFIYYIQALNKYPHVSLTRNNLPGMFQNTVMSIKFYFSQPFCSFFFFFLSLSSFPVQQVEPVHYVLMSSTAQHLPQLVKAPSILTLCAMAASQPASNKVKLLQSVKPLKFLSGFTYPFKKPDCVMKPIKFPKFSITLLVSTVRADQSLHFPITLQQSQHIKLGMSESLLSQILSWFLVPDNKIPLQASKCIYALCCTKMIIFSLIFGCS